MKTIIAATMLIGLCGCTGSSGEDFSGFVLNETSATTLSVSALQAQSIDSQVHINLQSSEIEYRVESDVDLHAVDVTCPSGQIMNLGRWVTDIERSGAEVRTGEGFMIFSSGGPDDMKTERVPVCTYPCYLHQESNGTWVCFGTSECGGF